MDDQSESEEEEKKVHPLRGNQFWRARKSHGRPKKFTTPKKLMKAAEEYFQWMDENPLFEQKVFSYQGDLKYAELAKMRAYTIVGLCVFIGVTRNYLTDLRDGLDLDTDQGKDFSRVISTIEDIIYTQKFEGAAADLLNANIIARELGLADKKELSSENPLTLVLKEISGNTLGPNTFNNNPD